MIVCELERERDFDYTISKLLAPPLASSSSDWGYLLLSPLSRSSSSLVSINNNISEYNKSEIERFDKRLISYM